MYIHVTYIYMYRGDERGLNPCIYMYTTGIKEYISIKEVDTEGLTTL